MSDMNKDENLQSNDINQEADPKEATAQEQPVKTVEVVDEDMANENKEATQQETENQQDSDAVESEEGQPEEEKEPKVKLGTKIKASFHNRKFKLGAYTTAVSAIVVVIILVANIFLSKFDMKIDLSSNAMFSLTKATKDYVHTLKDDITIYYMVESGSEYRYFTSLADKYDKLSSHIKVEYKDPVLYPKFASQYTDEKVTNNSVIVVNNTNGRYKYITDSDMRQTQMDQSYQSHVTGIDFEGKVTSALQYVTTENLPKFYQVSGHGEVDTGTSLSDLLSKQNVDLETLATAKQEKIPEDCDGLILMAPGKDYTKDEVTMVKDYLTKGGKAIIFADYNTNDCPNYASLLNYYGVEVVDGCVIEGDSDNMMKGYPQYIIPTVNKSVPAIKGFTSQMYLLTPLSVGLKKADTVRSSVQMQSFLSTSDKSYSKTNLKSKTMSKEDGDIDGPFDVGVSVTESYGGATTNLVVLGCTSLVLDDFLSVDSYANFDLTAAIVNNMSDSETQAVSVPVKPLQATNVTLTNAQQHFWLYTLLILLPVIIIGVGCFVVVRRRKK